MWYFLKCGISTKCENYAISTHLLLWYIISVAVCVQPLEDGAWAARPEGGGIAASQYSLMSLPPHYYTPPTAPNIAPPSPPPSYSPPQRHIALARRRMGRGGRLVTRV